jgi:hypothetical protein
MKITLDQATLDQAVRNHLRDGGVTAPITKVDFRYTRTPYAVFAEVELSEQRLKKTIDPSPVSEKEKVVPAETPAPAPHVPIVDPDNLPPVEPEPAVEEQLPGAPTSTLFGGG